MPANPRPLTKFTKPDVTRILPRHRLFRMLDQGRRFSAMWISGPAGSGKTTLVSSYIDNAKPAYLWYRLDQRDGDLATFFYYLGRTEQASSSDAPSLPPVMSPEYAHTPSGFTKRYFERLFRSMTTPGMFVLDNYQDAAGHGSFDQLLRDVLTVIPDGINLCVLSREKAPASLARSRVTRDLCEIGWQDLRFEPEETLSFVRIFSQKNLPRHLIEHLHEKTDGWVAGLLLLLKLAENHRLDLKALEGLAAPELYDYFASEIFEHAELSTQEFLLQTSTFPDTITAEMAKALTGLDRAKALLSMLVRNHWFTEQQSGSPPAYRYHPLFREFLQSRARDRFEPQRRAKITRESAHLLNIHGQFEAAIDLLLESEEYDTAIPLILDFAQTLALQGRFRSLQRWLQSIPIPRRRQPWVDYWLGVCLMPADPAAGRHHFQKALSRFDASQDTVGIFLSLCGILDSYTYDFGTFLPLGKWIPLLAEHSNQFDGLPSLEIKAQVTASMLFALSFKAPAHDDFKVWEERALTLLDRDIALQIKTRLLLPLILQRSLLGRLQEAEHFLHVFQGFADDTEFTPLDRITLKDMQAFLHWSKGEFDECSTFVQEALELGSREGISLMSPYVLAHGAACALSSGDLEAASVFLEKILPFANKPHGLAQESFHTLTLWKALLENDLPKADFHGESSLKVAAATGTPITIALNHVGMSLVLSARGRRQEAAKHLDQAFAGCRAIGSLQLEFLCWLVGAELALKSKDEKTGEEYLRQGMAMGAKHRFWNTWLWRPGPMASLCCEALRRNIQPTYVLELIRKRNLRPQTPPLDIESWPWPLKIITLGRFGILQDDEPLTFTKKTQHKPILLLKALIASGGRDIDAERIADLLWPGSTGDDAYSSLKTTLYRLRRLLGDVEAIHFRSGRLSLNPTLCWLDAWAFDSFLDQADQAGQEDSDHEHREQAALMRNKAIGLYRGRLLQPDEGLPSTLRDRLHSRFLRAVCRLAAHWEELRHWERAMEVYHAGLAADDTIEVCYRGLMVCNLELGRTSEALAAYDQCCSVLTAKCNLPPSPETEDLRRALLRNKPH